MQTKRRIFSRKSSRERSTPRVSRLQRKISENVMTMDDNVSELITSSVRKSKSGSILSKKSADGTANMGISEGSLEEKISFACMEEDMINDACSDDACSDKEKDGRVIETIFSPGFHPVRHVEDSSIPSEVSAIYLAMKNSKLECVDEYSQDAVEGTDPDDDFQDFDPYLFIRNLPDLSPGVPAVRPTLLPRKTRSSPPVSLVLDLDETLVHSTLEPCEDADFTFSVNVNLTEHMVYVRCRPYLAAFMERVAALFEIIVFTASQSIYAEQLLNVLDPKRRVFRHRVFRESCIFVEGNYLKDLSVLGRDLARVVIIDNSPQAFGFQVDNGIPIESWFDDPSDRELLLLLPFLESLLVVEDVRPLIAKKFNVRQRVEAAAAAAVAYHSLNFRDHFE